MNDTFSTDRRMLLTGLGGLAAGALLAPGRLDAGSLEPPGPPGPTMLPLADIEPRTVINQVNTPGNAEAMHVISTPGSFYLVENLTIDAGKSGILIEADDVTLDLSGFAIRCPEDTHLGAVVCGEGGRSGIVVRNGSMRPIALSVWSGPGVDLARDGGYTSLVENLQMSSCGSGVRVGPGSMVLDCEVVLPSNFGIHSGDGSFGIQAGDGSIVVGCRTQISILEPKGTGISTGGGTLVSNCSTEGRLERGIESGEASVIRSCMVGNSDGIALAPGDGCLVSDCGASQCWRDGIVLQSESLARENSVWLEGTDGAGNTAVRIEGMRNVVVDNDFSSYRFGTTPMNVDGHSNLIVRNVLKGMWNAPSPLPVLIAGNSWSILPGLEPIPDAITNADTNPDANLRV